jgi:Tropinone reductase 1
MKVIVAGGTRGIGRAIADAFLDAGHSTCVIGRNAPLDNPGHLYVAADFSKGIQVKAAITNAAGLLSGCDVFIHSVGTNIRKTAIDYSCEEFDHIFGVNLISAWDTVIAAHPFLLQSQTASVVFIGSVASKVYVGSGIPYAMTKAAMDQMTRGLAVEWAESGITVNTVQPWYTQTELAAPVLNDPARLATILGATPNKRVASPEDIAGIAVFLASPAARHITGTTIPVDGGFLAKGL